MQNGSVAIFGGDGAEDKPRKQIASAQVLLVRRCVLRGRFSDSFLFSRTQLQSQSLNDALRNRVLDRDYVRRGSINSITPQDVSGSDVEELCSDSKALAGVNEACGQDSVY